MSADDTPSSGMPSLLYASPFDRTGYAVAARRYLRALQLAGAIPAWCGLRNTNWGYTPTPDLAGAPTEQLELPRAAPPDAPLLTHCVPTSWPQMRQLVPNRPFIGQTVWEAERIPTRWQRELRPAGQIWVPTQWNADAFRASGVEVPMHVVPHPVEDVTPQSVAIDLDPDVFTFLVVSTWDRRKRPDLAIHAYLRAFTADDPVVLVVKTDPYVLAWATDSAVQRRTWWQVMDVVRQYPHAARVLLIDEPYDDHQMAWLVQRAQCYVSLTCAEGWGLGAFDAATLGIPLLITGHGGQMEWLGRDHPGAVPFDIVEVDHPDRTMFEAGMTWALPDVDAAATMMREMFDGTSAVPTAAAALASRLRHDYSLERIGRLMKELLT